MKFCMDNEQASRNKCEAALRDLSQDMERQISEGVYSVSGGYQLFKGDQQALVQKYWELPGKGVEVGTRAAPLQGERLHVPSPSPKKPFLPSCCFSP